MDKIYYGYDDIFVFPEYSELRSRSEVDTSTYLGNLKLDLPVISSNMNTITNAKMAIEMYRCGALGALHRFMSIEKNVKEFLEIKAADCESLISIGVGDESKKRAVALYDAGAKHFIIDVAHGDHILMKEMIEWLRDKWGKDILIIAGNVATEQGVFHLAQWGADIVKILLSSGSICATKVATSIGVPTYSCILECAKAADECGVKTIADGGLKNSSDFFKALVAGADYCFAGYLFAGTDEAAGELVVNETTGQLSKIYAGMASSFAQKSIKNEIRHVEGVSTTVSLKGPVRGVLNELKANLQSAMSYINSRTIEEIATKARWGVQTQAGHLEGTPHIYLRK